MAASESRHPMQVILHSGLGNQMFQYAAAKALAVERGCELLIDTVTGFRNDPFRRRYELGAFRLTSACLSGACPEAGHLRVRVALRATRELEIGAMKWWGRYHLPLLQKWSLRLAGVAFGYGESPRYFERIAASLREEFTLREEPSPVVRQWAERLQAGESVGLHLRLRHAESATGEVVSPRLAEPRRLEALLSYYRQAIEYMRGRVCSPFWFVVSDTHEFDPATLGLPADTPVFCGDAGRPPAEDLWLLSRSRHKIIGPSTFGWWGAWLSGPHGGVVCAPRVFRPGGSLKLSAGVYPTSWTILQDQASP